MKCKHLFSRKKKKNILNLSLEGDKQYINLNKDVSTQQIIATQHTEKRIILHYENMPLQIY